MSASTSIDLHSSPQPKNQSDDGIEGENSQIQSCQSLRTDESNRLLCVPDEYTDIVVNEITS